MTAQRHNKGKIDWPILDWKALEPLVQAMSHGEIKYARHDWKKGMSMEILYGCAMRHLVAMMNGETYDIESGILHAGHAMANLMMIAHYQQKEETEELRKIIKNMMQANDGTNINLE